MARIGYITPPVLDAKITPDGLTLRTVMQNHLRGMREIINQNVLNQLSHMAPIKKTKAGKARKVTKASTWAQKVLKLVSAFKAQASSDGQFTRESVNEFVEKARAALAENTLVTTAVYADKTVSITKVNNGGIIVKEGSDVRVFEKSDSIGHNIKQSVDWAMGTVASGDEVIVELKITTKKKTQSYGGGCNDGFRKDVGCCSSY